jgi:hypothetical protein
VKVRPIQRSFRSFSPYKKARAVERGRIVAKKGAKGPIFEGNMLLPKKCPFFGPINRIPVMAPISAPILGVHFFRGHVSLKMGHYAPFLATILAFSKTSVFLSNKRSEGCFVWAAPQLVLAPTIFIIALFS